MSRVTWFPALMAASLFLVGCGSPGVKPTASTQPPVVLVQEPVKKEVTDYEDFTGRTEAYRYVEVRARVTGYLDKVDFKDGETVKKGKPLFKIDQRTYLAAVRQGEANLRQAEARLRTMTRTFKRAEELRQMGKGSISQEEYDVALGNRDEAEAAVGVARANLDTAKINLDYTLVTAPLSGRLSRRMVDPGNTVTADVTPLTTIVQLDPIYVTFYIDERTFLRIRHLVKEGKIHTAQDARAEVKLGLADEKGYPDDQLHKGEVDFEDNQLDVGTGTYRVRAFVKNPEMDPRPEPTAAHSPSRGAADAKKKPHRFLSPGLFVRVRLPIGKKHPAILIPEEALWTADQGQKFVYVIGADNKSIKRPVTIGQLHKGLREIIKGVAMRENVVVSGLQRVRPNIEVTPKLAPAKGDQVTR